MTQEVVTRLRDDFDRMLGDDVATRQFCWGKDDLEFELSDANFESFQADYAKACKAMERWVRIARPVKAKRQTKAVVPQMNIKSYAAQYGLDWRDAEVRNIVREWAVEEGFPVSGKRIPRAALEAYIKVQSGA